MRLLYFNIVLFISVRQESVKCTELSSTVYWIIHLLKFTQDGLTYCPRNDPNLGKRHKVHYFAFQAPPPAPAPPPNHHHYWFPHLLSLQGSIMSLAVSKTFVNSGEERTVD